MFFWRKKRGKSGSIYYVSNSINLRESLGGVCLSWNLSWILLRNLAVQYILLEKILRKTSWDHQTLSRVHHVDFSSMKSSLGLLSLHLHVWSGLGQSPPFRPTRALRWQRSWAFSHVYEVAVRVLAACSIGTLHQILLVSTTWPNWKPPLSTLARWSGKIGWVWEVTGWSSRLQENYPSFQRNL